MARRFCLSVFVLLGLHAPGPAIAQGPAQRPEIRVASLSPPGWRPTDDQVRSATDLTSRYLAARDSGDYDQAYSLMAANLQTTLPLADYRRNVSAFNAQAGPAKVRGFVRMTWHNNPPGAPPGVYAAVDLVSRFQNVDRHCGYVVLRQVPDGFEVIRDEESFMDQENVRKIESEKSKEEVERLWAQLSARCPR